MAQTYLKHYYLQRLLSREFWRKLISGGLNLRRVVGDLAGNIQAGAAGGGAPRDFVAGMRAGLARFDGAVLVILSGNDLTAAEFRGVSATPAWRPLLSRPGVAEHVIEAANHTFSTRAWRDEVARVTGDWLGRLGQPARGTAA